MDLRFIAMITGCMLVGAGAAAYHRADELFTGSGSGATLAGATLAAAAPELPLFVRAAVGAPVQATWPSPGSVAFYDEMLGLRAALATAPVSAPEPTQEAPRVAAAGSEPAPVPPRAGAAPETGDTVNVVIRDRFGRPLRVERIDRRHLAGAAAHPPVRPRFYGSQPYGPPYGYGPYYR